MDPITAWALAVRALAEMVTEIVRGQPPEIRQQVWQWWLEDQARWRKLLNLDSRTVTGP